MAHARRLHRLLTIVILLSFLLGPLTPSSAAPLATAQAASLTDVTMGGSSVLGEATGSLIAPYRPR